MKVWLLLSIGLGFLVSASISSSIHGFSTEDKRAEKNDALSVTVAFGSGLNTLPAVEP
jgi:hypothetical protein